MFEELRTFVEVAESKSFTRTAQKLNFSQPTISQQVRKVEVFFGNRMLLTRSTATKQIELTEEGVAAYRCAKGILDLLDDTLTEIERIQDNEASKKLRIGASMTIGNYMLPKVLKAFRDAFSDVHISILVGNTSEICDALKEERVDVGLIEGRDIMYNFRRTGFFMDHLFLAASPQVAAAVPEFSVSRLGKMLWITREPGSGTEQYIDSFISSNNIRVETRIEYNSNFAIKETVKEGLGITFLSQLVMQEDLRSGKLVKLPLNKPYTREFSYILPEDKLCGPVVQSFLDTLLESVKAFSD